MNILQCKLLVIGAGPGGYVCAIRAGRMGVDTVIVDAGPLGGTCLNVGCIPSKALIHAAEQFHTAQRFTGDTPLGIRLPTGPTIDLAKTVEWKNGNVGKLNSGVGALLKGAGVKVLFGQAAFRDGKTVEVATPDGLQQVEAETIVIATGSRPVDLPSLPFGGNVISSTEALALTDVPKRLSVVGGGYIGLELGTAFAKLGSKVTVVEAGPRILPQYDAELTAPVAKRLEALGAEVLTDALARDMVTRSKLRISGDGADHDIPSDKVLVTVGRAPQLTGLKLDELSLAMDGPFIRIDDQCRTSMRGVFAIGDVTGEPMLAHRAMAQGEMVAGIVAGETLQWDSTCIPAVCFTDPEIVTAGFGPQDVDEAAVTVSRFPFLANGKALTAEAQDGFVRVLARKDNQQIIGIQAVGHGVSELSAAFSMAIEMQARLQDLAATIYAHPTQSEALQEAALKGLGRAIHI